MAVKKTKKRKSVLWLSQCTAGRTLCHLQSHTAAVHIATRRLVEHKYCEAVELSTEQWADSVCCLCCCIRLVSIAHPARKFLSAPPTSAASQQLFSAAGQTYSDRRSSLLGENAEKLLFLAYNIRLFDFKYWSLHTERLTQWAILSVKVWACDHGFIKKYIIFVHLLFHVATDICKS